MTKSLDKDSHAYFKIKLLQGYGGLNHRKFDNSGAVLKERNPTVNEVKLSNVKTEMNNGFSKTRI